MVKMIGAFGWRNNFVHARSFLRHLKLGNTGCHNGLSSCSSRLGRQPSPLSKPNREWLLAPVKYRWRSSGRIVNGLEEHDLLQRKDILIEGADGKSPPVIDFTKAEIIFKRKSTHELARSFVVLQMCSYNFFVDNSLKVKIGQRF